MITRPPLINPMRVLTLLSTFPATYAHKVTRRNNVNDGVTAAGEIVSVSPVRGRARLVVRVVVPARSRDSKGDGRSCDVSRYGIANCKTYSP